MSPPPAPIWTFVSSLPLPKGLQLPDNVQRWIPGSSPFSTHTEVFAALAAYLAIIFGGQFLMKGSKPFPGDEILKGGRQRSGPCGFTRVGRDNAPQGGSAELKPLFMLHNFLLSAGSGLVLALMIEELIPIIWNHGWFYAICNTAAWTPRLETLYIINYYVHWELADTCFLVVKKKPLMFLHVFHHTATAALCYTQLNGRTSVSWVPIVANLTVHVLMYLTTLQITQFVVDLFIVYFASYAYFAATYFLGQLPSPGSCAGTEGAAIFGCALLTSYLFLFIAFYKKTYNAQVAAGKNKKAAAKGSAKAVAAKTN
ncbi:SPOSA6832_03918 [Sporobolomyces salmonicolor]|uniref:Elongation of fatty acids protein n=1 Tax=Sporidiobolus salmonicolor TaxID=5005 RepID=A0A0D6EQI8_SPOSA|nr:SPOSA6832_03918 [Sporobolomyces salmonicolor]